MCEAGFKKSVWCCWMLDSQLSFTKKCLWCSCRKLSVAGEEWTLLQWKELFCCMPTKLEPVCMCGDLNRFCSFHPSMKWWVAQTGLWLLILQKSLFTMKKNKKKKKTDFGRSRKSPYSKTSLTRENLFDSVWSSITVTPYLLSCIRWTTPFKVSWELKGSRKTFGQVFLPEIKNSN